MSGKRVDFITAAQVTTDPTDSSLADVVIERSGVNVDALVIMADNGGSDTFELCGWDELTGQWTSIGTFEATDQRYGGASRAHFNPGNACSHFAITRVTQNGTVADTNGDGTGDPKAYLEVDIWR